VRELQAAIGRRSMRRVGRIRFFMVEEEYQAWLLFSIRGCVCERSSQKSREDYRSRHKIAERCRLRAHAADKYLN
jgi:hypothetical protein